MKQFLFAFAVFLLTAGTSNAAIKTYDISWTGTSNYSLVGNFSFNAATAGEHVNENELLSFFIEGFRGTTSIGTYSGRVLNFNFNTATEEFVIGGSVTSGSGQLWNHDRPGIGFTSSARTQALLLNYSLVNSIPVENSTLTATLSSVPLPPAALLFSAALGGLGFFTRRRRLKAAA
ncbi:VPLPA-CTERM sorting domain-containing protein [Sneathiella glossodoripedis]|uniref:VPLPA-CTERM sorting domain-containing protein n=1 Tax=Sneathiella glossodoripedis TaxID=418853 RepID=UPI00046F7239|nr:VPLPA-CTERM sorting domain-containing protein [Sneathiella glossodoripedis]